MGFSDDGTSQADLKVGTYTSDSRNRALPVRGGRFWKILPPWKHSLSY
jgi:hypothetical protein